MNRTLCLVLGIAFLLPISAQAAESRSENLADAKQLRRPVAAALVDEGRILAVANERSGSISFIDVEQGMVREELAVGKRLTDIATVGNGQRLLVVDEAQHELVEIGSQEGRWQIRERLAVSEYPTTLAVSADGHQATVACRWSWRFQVIDLTARPMRVAHTIDLPFAPRNQIALDDNKHVVADAFGGRLALIDMVSGRVVHAIELPAHNIRGLALAEGGKKLLVAHQTHDQTAPTTRDTVWNGWVINNALTMLDIEHDLLAASSKRPSSETLIVVGDGFNGSGDPAGMATIDADHVALCLAGVDELAIFRTDERVIVERMVIGKRPTAVVAGPQRRLYAVNTLSDSITVVDGDDFTLKHEISLGPQPPLYPRDRGERLFYDARLSTGEWFSCHSCHTDGHTNGLRADTFGDRTEGAPKRTPTLLGTSLTDPWSWRGDLRELRDQVRKSVEMTMHSAPDIGQHEIDDLVAYLHTLPPPPPREPARADKADQERHERGRRIFARNRCAECHVPSLTFTSPAAYDVGFRDEVGHDKFNPPSLRGVGQGYRFFHDGRAATLKEVFQKFDHQLQEDLSEDQIADLVRYLKSL